MSKAPKQKPRAEKMAYPMGVTEAQIKKWKGEHGEVHLVDVPMDDDVVAYGYFKRPTLDVISAVSKFEQSEPVKAAMILYEGCKLRADDVLETSDEAKLAAAQKVVKLFKRRTAGIKKL